MNYNNTNEEGEYNLHDYQPRPVSIPLQEIPQEIPQEISRSQPSYTYATDYSYPQQNSPPAAPVHAERPVTNPVIMVSYQEEIKEMEIDETELLKIYSYTRTYCCFWVFDIYLCIILGITITYFYLIAIPFAALGLYITVGFKSCYIFQYFVYLGLRIVSVLLVVMIYYPSGGRTENRELLLLLGVISILVSGYVLYFGIKIYMMIKMLSEDKFNVLCNGWTPVQGTQIKIIYY